jgi:hypothetical protein
LTEQDNRLDDRLGTLRTAVSAAPSVLDDVMHCIAEMPEPAGRRRQWKQTAIACLATAVCLAVLVTLCISGGGNDPKKTAQVDPKQLATHRVKSFREGTMDVRGNELSENVRAAERSKAEAGVQLHESETFDSAAEKREFRRHRSEPGSRGGKHIDAAFVEGPSREPTPGDFAGTWHGTAAENPEDGMGADPLQIRLSVARNGHLEGIASGPFVSGGDVPLQDVYAVGNRLEFKVRHRTGVMIQITLGLSPEGLKGDAIPIRSDQSRCDVVLQRRRPGPKPE